MNGDHIQWLIPIFWILFLLVHFYRAENKRQWLKTHGVIAGVATVFMSPMLVVWLVGMLADK